METKYKQFDIYQQRKSWNLNNSEKVSRQKHLILPITMHLISVLKKIMHAWDDDLFFQCSNNKSSQN